VAAPSGPAGPGGVSEPRPQTPQHRLDPDRAAASAPSQPAPEQPSATPTVDTRRYRWMIGIFGLALVVVISVYQFASHGVATTGVPPGQRIHFFAAPLAASTLNGAANLNPPCTIARHDPRALNVCLLVRRAPLVLAFFVTGSANCIAQVDTLETVSRQFSPGDVQFAAVAVGASHSSVAAQMRSHGWTIPVAYDADGRVGAQYGVQICPLIELAKRGGVVADRLIGNHWLQPQALARQVRSLVNR
jgi:peroxiredoxin